MRSHEEEGYSASQIQLQVVTAQTGSKKRKLNKVLTPQQKAEERLLAQLRRKKATQAKQAEKEGKEHAAQWEDLINAKTTPLVITILSANAITSSL